MTRRYADRTSRADPSHVPGPRQRPSWYWDEAGAVLAGISPPRARERLAPWPASSHPPWRDPDEIAPLCTAVLGVVVACTLGLLAPYLLFGGIAYALALPEFGEGREGIELVLFPLAAVATTLLLRARGRDVPLVLGPRAAGPLRLLAAPVLPCIAVYLAVTGPGEPAITVERLIGAAMIAAAGVGGAIFFPRLTAAVAGAIAAPAMFGLLLLAGARLVSLLDEPLQGTGLGAMAAWAIVIGFAAIWFLGPPALAYLAWRLRGCPVSHALWVGAITLFIGVSGFTWAWAMTTPH